MEEEKITFIRKPAKHGWIKSSDGKKEQTFVFTIPQNYIRSGKIDPDFKYKIELTLQKPSKEKTNELLQELDQKLTFGVIDMETYVRLTERIKSIME